MSPKSMTQLSTDCRKAASWTLTVSLFCPRGSAAFHGNPGRSPWQQLLCATQHQLAAGRPGRVPGILRGCPGTLWLLRLVWGIGRYEAPPDLHVLCSSGPDQLPRLLHSLFNPSLMPGSQVPAESSCLPVSISLIQALASSLSWRWRVSRISATGCSRCKHGAWGHHMPFLRWLSSPYFFPFLKRCCRN